MKLSFQCIVVDYYLTCEMCFADGGGGGRLFGFGVWLWGFLNRFFMGIICLIKGNV